MVKYMIMVKLYIQSLTLSMCVGFPPCMRRYCTTLICPPAQASESTVWSLLVV